MAGLIRRDFQDTVRQFPLLGSIPIIGTLFRSTSFQKEETELVIIVTPRLVKPVRAAALKVPTDRVGAAERGRPVPARPDRHRRAGGDRAVRIRSRAAPRRRRRRSSPAAARRHGASASPIGSKRIMAMCSKLDC